MKNQSKKSKILIAAFMLLIINNIYAKEVKFSSSVEESKTDTNSSGKLNIHYLKRHHLSISANGINRLHFAKARITKLVGNSNQYEALVSDNGEDLFLTSKVPPKEMIDLTVMLADGRAIDLALKVTDQQSPSIIELDVNQKSENEAKNKADSEIKKMIDHMLAKNRGKYFVQLLDHRLESGKSWLKLRQRAFFRYEKIAGADIKYTHCHNDPESKGESLSTEEFKGIFKNVLAIAIKNEFRNHKMGKDICDIGRAFIVFNYEGQDAK